MKDRILCHTATAIIYTGIAVLMICHGFRKLTRP